MELGRNVEIQTLENYTAAGFGDDLESSTIDMLGFDGVLIIYKLGAITATGVPTLTVKDSSDDSTYASISGASQAGDSDDDNLILAINVHKPTKRYLRANLNRATANVVLDGAIAIKYGPNKSAVTQGSTVVGIDFVIGGN